MLFQPSPDSLLVQQNNALLQLEIYMVGRINDERTSRGLSRLSRYAVLGGVARAHSREMHELNYFAHESPTPRFRTPSDRYKLAARTQPRLLAENLSYLSCRAWISREDLLEKVVRQWLDKPIRAGVEEVERSHQGLMNSPGHRANILHPEVTLVGVGMVCADGFLWVTQMFAQL